MNKLITILFLLFTFTLQAQQNEIKIDALGPIWEEEINVSYEWLFKDKIGIEGGIGYIYSPERLSSISNTTVMIDGVIPFKKRAWSFLVSGKYYFSPKPKGNRFFLGTFILYRTQPKIEDAYFEAYEMYFNEPDKYLPDANLSVGLSTGYKILLFKDQIILEPILGAGIRIDESEFDVGGFGVSQEFFVRLNLGYRF
ncbi:MAG: DUF3575 domain-containing protein [Saprospiraceae bacterium]